MASSLNSLFSLHKKSNENETHFSKSKGRPKMNQQTTLKRNGNERSNIHFLLFGPVINIPPILVLNHQITCYFRRINSNADAFHLKIQRNLSKSFLTARWGKWSMNVLGLRSVCVPYCVWHNTILLKWHVLICERLCEIANSHHHSSVSSNRDVAHHLVQFSLALGLNW